MIYLARATPQPDPAKRECCENGHRRRIRRALIHPVIRYVSAHSDLAYETLFLAAFLEAVPVVGTFIPGSTIIPSLSALIATGDLNLVVVFCSVISGAALGDGLAFWLGYRYPSRVRNLWPLNKHQVLVYQGEMFFQKYGRAAVLFARFLPPVRAFVSVTAGAMGMTPRQFYPINLVAILLWAPVQVVPGMLAGNAYRHAGAIAGHLTLPIIAGVAGIAFLIWGIRRMLKFG
ncbi:MAG: DedA family protein [Candidatus Acidiferrales bacterium]